LVLFNWFSVIQIPGLCSFIDAFVDSVLEFNALACRSGAFARFSPQSLFFLRRIHLALDLFRLGAPV
jgi:hypothetical protein